MAKRSSAHEYDIFFTAGSCIFDKLGYQVTSEGAVYLQVQANPLYN
jgi:hypothetical protein